MPYNVFEVRKRYTDISLSEFKFYNKSLHFLTDDELTNIVNMIEISNRKYFFWTNTAFKNQNIGFVFINLKKNDNRDSEECGIYVTTVSINSPSTTVEQFNDTKYLILNKLHIMFDLSPQQIRILENIFMRRRSYSENLNIDPTQAIFLYDWNQVISALIIHKIFNLYEHNDWQSFYYDINSLFPDVLDKKQPNIEIQDRQDSMYIYKIIEKRFNNKNYRIAVVALTGSYRPEWAIRICTEDNPHYIYYDEGRVVIMDGAHQYFLSTSCTQSNKNGIIIENNIYKMMARDIAMLLPPDQFEISPQIYRWYSDRASKFNPYNNISNQIYDEIVCKYKECLLKNKTIKIENTIITNKSIEIEGTNFKVECNETFLDIPNYIGAIRNILQKEDMQYNFNILWDELLKMSTLSIINRHNTTNANYKNFTKVDFKVNKSFANFDFILMSIVTS